MSKFKPCPFCGCSVPPAVQGNGIGDNWLECTECGASTRLREDGAGSEKDWNRRAARATAEQPEPDALLRAFKRIEALRKGLFEARDAMRVMSNWVKKSDPAGHSWAVRMVDRANDVLSHKSQQDAAIESKPAEQSAFSGVDSAYQDWYRENYFGRIAAPKYVEIWRAACSWQAERQNSVIQSLRNALALMMDVGFQHLPANERARRYDIADAAIESQRSGDGS